MNCTNLDRFVSVPGQLRWHSHTCPVCGSSWTHIAPTPMTARKNIEIHTCTKCGELVWRFEPLPSCSPFLLGLVAGLGAAAIYQLIRDKR
jgi:predicted RNA-binding Zn-ribbon protein involved in translation (DUF1610 family)